jgi:hypothetical protein
MPASRWWQTISMSTCCSTVKIECAVGFGKVVMRADLNRPFGCVLHQQAESAPTWVQNVVGAVGDDFARVHFCQSVGDRAGSLRVAAVCPTRFQDIGGCTVTNLVPSGKVAST